MDLNDLSNVKRVFMDLVKRGEYPKDANQFDLGGSSGYNLPENSIDFDVVNTVNNKKYNFIIHEITE